jgi:hypothetical protein
MIIRLYDPASFPFGSNLVLRLPAHLRHSPPVFVWRRFPFQNELDGVPQYSNDGMLAVSNHPTGPVTPVRVSLEHQGVIKVPASLLKGLY